MPRREAVAETFLYGCWSKNQAFLRREFERDGAGVAGEHQEQESNATKQPHCSFSIALRKTRFVEAGDHAAGMQRGLE
jgi:hypothetical protein